jgi:ABC-type transport system involved in multi-copper enzyme maturation permease subunit
MVDESPLIGFGEWFASAWRGWCTTIGLLVVVALIACWIVAATRYGPLAGARTVLGVFFDGLKVLLRISPRRIGALAWLAVKESVRRRILAVFALFLVLLLLAGWFLDPESVNRSRLYISFVLTATSYLVLLLALFLSVLSLPADIKNRTIHTVMTKPVRPAEIVLGRILGFVVIGTGLLGMMGAVSYVFVVRGVSHTHRVEIARLQDADAARGGKAATQAWKGRTSLAQGHRHDVYLDALGRGRVEQENNHRHSLAVSPDLAANKKAIVETSGPEGMLVARLPVYGRLRFVDRSGKPAEKGVNVGDEWTYRSYIEGGTLGAAVWTFSNVTAADFPNGLPVELNLGVFRTHKGDIEKGVPGSLAVRNPKTGLRVEVRIFPAKEFVTDVQFIPRELQTADGRTVDLFRDLTADGQVEIWLRCLVPAQYFGAAQRDLYLRASDTSFAVNFAKGYLGIWLQMVLIVGFGVMFSTFLSGPVAMIATLGVLVIGFFSAFVTDLAGGKNIGGGPMESAIRLVTQDNLVSELEPGLQTTAAKMADHAFEQLLRGVAASVPSFADYSFADFVADGFYIPRDRVLMCLSTMLAFLLPVFVVGYFFLKTREVAR